VGVVRGLAEHAQPPGLLVPAHDAVVGNVAPQQAARIAEIDRALAPAHVGRDALDAGKGQTITRKTRVEDLDRRIRGTLARLPAAEGCARDHRCADRAGADEQTASSDLHGVSPFMAAALRGRVRLYPGTVSLRQPDLPMYGNRASAGTYASMQKLKLA